CGGKLKVGSKTTLKSLRTCEYCGTELVSSPSNQKFSSKSKLDQFIEDSGIKEAYNKVKESLKKLKR
ncbi:MAG: hypothetical protein ACFE9R_14920, partial [Candidatus Hermodarchaeota archaeon]